MAASTWVFGIVTTLGLVVGIAATIGGITGRIRRSHRRRSGQRVRVQTGLGRWCRRSVTVAGASLAVLSASLLIEAVTRGTFAPPDPSFWVGAVAAIVLVVGSIGTMTHAVLSARREKWWTAAWAWIVVTVAALVLGSAALATNNGAILGALHR